jgi:signal transduction histidine kinase/integral membrane sensor domain MASE1
VQAKALSVDLFAGILLLAAVYAGVARLGLMMDAVAGFATLVWPPTGIALAALLVLGFRVWPGIMLGAFAANLWIGASVPVASGIAVGNTLEALIGAYALRHLAGFDEALERLRDVLSLVVIAGLLSTLLSASIGVASLRLGGVITSAQAADTWRAWWLGDLIGDLLVAPVLLTLAAARRSAIGMPRRPRPSVEAAAVGVSTAAISFALFGPLAVGLHSMVYLFPPLTWAALRFGPRGASLTTLLVSAIALWGTAMGYGPFVRDSLATSLLPLQSFMAVVAITALALGAAIAERNAAIRAKERSEAGSRFLAEASKRLQESLNDEVTLEKIAGLAVPAIADCCSIIVIDERERVRRVATVHKDPDKQHIAEDLGRRFPGPQHSGADLGTVLRRERALWLSDGGELNVTSCLVAPLRSRAKGLGVVSLLRTGPAPGYDEADRALAEELADRAALAVENARLYQEAQGAVLSREEVLAVVSHDLNNVLSAMMGSTQLMLRSAEEEGRQVDKKGLRIIQRSAQRMARLIGDLLDAASLDAGVLSLEVAPQNADDLIREAVEMEGPLAEQKGLRLDGSSLDVAVKVVCDRSRIVQVLANLISNALKFTEVGTIRLGIRRSERELVFEVCDTGKGIPPEQLEHIFDRYWTGKVPEASGHGLGLHIAKGIIEAHGGKIWAESHRGQGSAFFFTLPLAG